jgi:hypothetical protein
VVTLPGEQARLGRRAVRDEPAASRHHEMLLQVGHDLAGGPRPRQHARGDGGDPGELTRHRHVGGRPHQLGEAGGLGEPTAPAGQDDRGDFHGYW